MKRISFFMLIILQAQLTFTAQQEEKRLTPTQALILLAAQLEEKSAQEKEPCSYHQQPKLAQSDALLTLQPKDDKQTETSTLCTCCQQQASLEKVFALPQENVDECTIQLACGDYGHFDCLSKYFHRDNHCPNCKRSHTMHAVTLSSVLEVQKTLHGKETALKTELESYEEHAGEMVAIQKKNAELIAINKDLVEDIMAHALRMTKLSQKIEEQGKQLKEQKKKVALADFVEKHALPTLQTLVKTLESMSSTPGNTLLPMQTPVLVSALKKTSRLFKPLHFKPIAAQPAINVHDAAPPMQAPPPPAATDDITKRLLNPPSFSPVDDEALSREFKELPSLELMTSKNNIPDAMQESEMKSEFEDLLGFNWPPTPKKKSVSASSSSSANLASIPAPVPMVKITFPPLPKNRIFSDYDFPSDEDPFSGEEAYSDEDLSAHELHSMKIHRHPSPDNLRKAPNLCSSPINEYTDAFDKISLD